MFRQTLVDEFDHHALIFRNRNTDAVQYWEEQNDRSPFVSPTKTVHVTSTGNRQPRRVNRSLIRSLYAFISLCQNVESASHHESWAISFSVR